jgi:large subunit ribosomal protein L25
MQTFKLSLKRRGSGKAARREFDDGHLLGVVYGQGVDTTSVVGERKVINKVLDEAGTSHIIELTVDDDAPLNVLVKDLDHDPVTNNIRHFDLHAVRKGEKIDVEVPVELVGEAPAAKVGMVVHQLIDSLEVRTDPAHIPEKFAVDISRLSDVGDTIHVSDIQLDDNVELDEDLLQQPIVKIDEVVELQVEDETPEADAADVEAEHGAEEGEEGEGGEEAAPEPAGEPDDKSKQA